MSAVTGISGIQLSAASAAYAPTNSADVSAIASAYQVVSSLGGKNSYVTSINSKYISATHAFNAEFAKKVHTGAGSTETAYISSLMGIDSATCSAIASAYAESAASSKQDTLSFGYDDNKISAINGSALAGQGGGGLVTAIGTSESGITSINNSGLVDTAALHSADYSSLYVQEPLYISSTGDSSYIGISGDIGGIDSATCSAIASAYAESAASSKQDTLSFGYDSDKISAINGSALAGEAQVVTAVGTETAYTPDGVSDVVTSINGNYISALSADSAFQASYDEEGRELTSLASEYVVSSIASSYAESAVSGKADSSALSSYALSADVSGTVDLVSTQSANWGGSALALSAGPGISLTLSGNTLVASTDETVLWSGTPVTVGAATAGLTLTESPYNFERVALYWVPWNYTVNSLEKQEAVTEARITNAIPRIGSVTEWNAEASNTMFIFVLNAYFDASKFYTQSVKYFSIGDWTVNTQGTGSYITKIVGINRTAEA